MLLKKTVLFGLAIAAVLWSDPSNANVVVKTTPETSSSGLTAQFVITGVEARNLWAYLEKSKTYGGFVVTEGAAGSQISRTPSMRCRKVNGGNYDPPRPETDPSLYSCYLILDSQGVAR